MKAFLIPGSGENLKSRDYQAILDLYKQLGYEPHFVPIDWKYRTVDDWVEQVEKRISKKDLQDSLLSGFSFGSMIALAVAAKTNSKQLLLFSLSPYFKEDMPLPEKYGKWAGKRRIENFEKMSFNKLAAEIESPTIIFIGSKEKEKYKDMWHRSNEAHKRIKDSKLILVEGAGHDVTHPSYIKAIVKNI
jgi:esterase/lipase